MIGRYTSYLIAFIFTICVSSSYSQYAHYLKNNTDFETKWSVDYLGPNFICQDEKITVKPHSEHRIGAGVCILSEINVQVITDPKNPNKNPWTNKLKKSHTGDGVWIVQPKLDNPNEFIVVAKTKDFWSNLADTGEQIWEQGLKPIGAAAASLILGTIKDIVYGTASLFTDDDVTPVYCFNKNGAQPPAKEATIDDPAVQKEDTEGLIPYIKKYSPIVWLHGKEKALPIRVPEYFTGPNTSIVDKNTNQVVVPKGQITMPKINELFNKGGERFFEVGNYDEPRNNCVLFGSNPEFNTDANGNLNTPIYVMTYDNPEDPSKMFIQYVFYYGFNVPYDIKDLLDNVPGITKEQAVDWANAHEADLEHITVEIDKNSKDVTRIHYAGHGSEGAWYKPGEYETEGTHPVVFSARGSHASYPKEGTYVRIYGFANDVTERGKRWVPELVRIYKPSDPRFNVNKQGWFTHAGALGRHGVGAAQNQVGQKEVKGRSMDEIKFCPKSNSIQEYGCIRYKAATAKP